GNRLQLRIEREIDVLARLGFEHAHHRARDRAAARVTTHRRATGLSAQHLVQLELEAAQRRALRVHAAEQLVRNRAVRIEPLLYRLEVHALHTVQRLARRRAEATAQDHPAARHVRDAPRFAGTDTGHVREDADHPLAIGHLARCNRNAVYVTARCERNTIAIVDRAARRRQCEPLLLLLLRTLGPLHALA